MPIRFWKPKEVDYLRDNHRDLQPSEMAKVLKTSETRVTKKLSELHLQTKRAIDQQMIDAQVLQMLSDGVHYRQVMAELNVCKNRVKKVESYLKVLQKPTIEKVEVDAELDELIRHYKPDHEESGEYTYSGLSRDEQIIYHQI